MAGSMRSQVRFITLQCCQSRSSTIVLAAVIFEITSAYGTVGLSLGSPVVSEHNDPPQASVKAFKFSQTGTSLAGSFRKLSKLVLCAVMIRGRHRGLPIAIDRAVLWVFFSDT